MALGAGTTLGPYEILDFGLAKVVRPLAPVGGGEETTSVAPLTGPGTVGYMSPGQVRGQDVDQRSDVFSFGVVLYEMLSGPSLTGALLRRALVEPARMEGVSFEDQALVEEMLESVEGARGALPLLAFAVSRLWEQRDRKRSLLTREAYEAIGGVAGALAQHAE